MSDKRFGSLTKGRLKTLLFVVVDAILMNAAMILAILLRYSDSSFGGMIKTFLYAIPILAVVTAVIFYCLRVYRIIWKFAGLRDIYKLLAAIVISDVVYYAAISLLNHFFPDTFKELHLSVYVVGPMFAVGMLTLYRMVLRQKDRVITETKKRREKAEKVLVVGGGSAGAMIIKDLVNNPRAYHVVGIVDDDIEKKSQRVYGVSVLGGRDQIPFICSKYDVDTILFCIPTAPAQERVEILNLCAVTGCQVKVLPGVVQLMNGNIDQKLMRKVEIEDLLERDPIVIDNSAVMGFVTDKVVLVTGGGGSIGSELCRQLAEHNPKELIIFDIYENNAYAIQNELKRKHPELNLTVLIGSVRDEKRLCGIFEEHRPNVVFHAAAHKHVPLMEDSPREAIKNNVFGTLNTARTADKYGVERFVLISTDKAVNPTNVMGATKRICEMIVQTYNGISKTEYVAVRFGNVLGSNGSVVPLFKEQIANGGPVTVTHPEIIRYFMTIPEAVSLVLQAGALAKGGEIFVLDMGKPVRILDMAEKLIRLSGYEPYTDIKITFSGLRPGEKLYEELLMDEEGLSSTENKLIYIGKPIKLAPDFLERLERLREALKNEDEVDARAEIKALVPTYHRPVK